MGWEDFGQKIADAGKDVSDKVKKVADLVCLKQKLASEERKLQTAYMEIGKLYYEKHEGEIDEEYIPRQRRQQRQTTRSRSVKQEIRFSVPAAALTRARIPHSAISAVLH